MKDETLRTSEAYARQLLFFLFVLFLWLSACAPPTNATSTQSDQPAQNPGQTIVEFTAIGDTSPSQFSISTSGMPFPIPVQINKRSCPEPDEASHTIDEILNLPFGEDLCALAQSMVALSDGNDQFSSTLTDLARYTVAADRKNIEEVCGRDMNGCYLPLHNIPIGPEMQSFSNMRTVIHEFCHGMLDVNGYVLRDIGGTQVAAGETEITVFGSKNGHAEEILADLCMSSTMKSLRIQQGDSANTFITMNYFNNLLDDLIFSPNDKRTFKGITNQVDAAATWIATNNKLPDLVNAMKAQDLHTFFAILDGAFSDGASNDAKHGLDTFSELLETYETIWEKHSDNQ